MAWVYGLIRQESRFIMNARSSASAQGLMQIIPPTARWIARRLGVRDFRIEQLNDLDTNLRFGTYYLKNVLDDLDGSPLLASAGYNAGPNRPRTWRSTLPFTVEGAVFAEIIPFTETRDYVKKVLSNATYYGMLLTGEPRSLKTLLGSVAPMPAKASELP
jgi:soluble lytic murein transglycosylase